MKLRTKILHLVFTVIAVAFSANIFAQGTVLPEPKETQRNTSWGLPTAPSASGFGQPLRTAGISMERKKLKKADFKEGRPTVLTDIYTFKYIAQKLNKQQEYSYKNFEYNLFAQVNNELIKSKVANIIITNDEEHTYHNYDNATQRNAFISNYAEEKGLSKNGLYALLLDLEDINIQTITSNCQFYIYIIDMATMETVNRYEYDIHADDIRGDNEIEILNNLIFDIADHCKYLLKDQIKKDSKKK